MPDNEKQQDKPFVVNDRRKFRMDGELREGVQLESPTEPKVESEPVKDETPAAGPVAVESRPAPVADAGAEPAAEGVRELPPPPTPEEVEQVRTAYEATAERLDTMMRATNPGGEHLPPMDFTRLVQSIYMSAMMQLGAGTEQGQQARVDLLGAKQSIDMLGVIGEKTKPNLSEQESQLMDAALFELRMGFLEITQMLARQAAAKQGAPGAQPGGGPAIPGMGPGGVVTGGGPRIVR